MSETGPKDPRPIETENGQLIVYIDTAEIGVHIECPALGINWAIPGPSYKEGTVMHSFETVARSKSRVILNRAAQGEQFPKEKLERAKRCANGKPDLPLVFVKFNH